MANEQRTSLEEFTSLVLKQLQDNTEAIKELNKRADQQHKENRKLIEEIEDKMNAKIDTVKNDIVANQNLHLSEDSTKFTQLFTWKGRVEGIGISIGTLIGLVTL